MWRIWVEFRKAEIVAVYFIWRETITENEHFFKGMLKQTEST